MKVAIEIITGGLFYVEIGEDATVESLKKEIASKEGFEEDRLIVMHKNGRLLIKDDQTRLRDYGVCDGTIMYLFFKPLGESKWPMYFPDNATFSIKER